MSAWERGIPKTGRAATLYVAANDATVIEKALADYLCDGTDDHVQINAALTALPPASGGTVGGGNVGLSSGTFSIGAAVTYARPNSTLFGTGQSTVLKGQAGCGNIWIVAVNNTGCQLRDLKIDGNKAVNSAYTTTTGCYVTTTDNLVENVTLINSPGYGFFFEVGTVAAMGRNLVSDGCVNVGYYVRAAASPNGNATTLIGCIARNNGSDGFANDSGIARFIGCIAYGNTGNGYGSSAADSSADACEASANLRGFSFSGARATVRGCVARLNTQAGYLIQGADSQIDANKAYQNGYHGIQSTGVGSQITNNNSRENSTGAAATYDNIIVSGNYSFVKGNTARRGASGNRAAYGLRIAAGTTAAVVQPNDLYDSGMTGDFLDSGTGTRFIRTSELEANAVTAPRANINPTPGQTTTSTTLVAMTAGSVSFTTSPQLGQIYLFGRMRLSSSAASGNISVYLYKDGVIHQEIVIQNLAANYMAQAGFALPLTMTGIAANTTYTFALYWSGPVGTTTFGDGSLTIQEFKR